MLEYCRMERVIQIKNKKFVVQSVRATHPDHESLVCTWSGRTYLVRVFSVVEEFDKAMADYKVLKHAGINMAKICFHDDANHTIAFDYFPEEDCLKVLSKGPMSDLHFEALLSLYRFARFSKVALDWAPQNFMLRGFLMFYLPTKWEKLTDDNHLEKEGIRLWFLGKEGRELLERKGYNTANLPSLSELEVNKAVTLATVRYW